MNGNTIRLGLVGKDVSKSLSGKMHTFILSSWGVECEYRSFSVPQDGFDDVMRTLLGDFDGFNVTIPYKRDVFAYVDEVCGDAQACGSVNTVLSDTRQGYNTDGAGFLQMLKSAAVDVKGKRVLVLGAGGSGRSSAAALKSAGADVYLYRRNRAELEEACAQLGVTPADNPEKGGYDIVVNATGVGMHDSEGRSPVAKSAFDGAKVAVDLIYVPSESEFLRLAKTCGLQTVNGESMLFYQAYYADCLFLARPADEAEAKRLYEKYLSRER